jgi:hypothetical protein
VQSLVTNQAVRDDLASGKTVTVCLPSQSLRLLASTSRPAPVVVPSPRMSERQSVDQP